MKQELFKHETVNQYDTITTKKLWAMYPDLMLNRFCLCFGIRNAGEELTIIQRLQKIRTIDGVIDPRLSTT